MKIGIHSKFGIHVNKIKDNRVNTNKEKKKEDSSIKKRKLNIEKKSKYRPKIT